MADDYSARGTKWALNQATLMQLEKLLGWKDQILRTAGSSPAELVGLLMEHNINVASRTSDAYRIVEAMFANQFGELPANFEHKNLRTFLDAVSASVESSVVAMKLYPGASIDE